MGAKVSKHFSHGLWAMPFRPFFLSAATYGCVSLTVWIANVSGNLNLMLGTQWHIQEVIYGFSVAVIIGFLLTAVQTWTQHATLKGWTLIGIYLLWFSARCLSITFPTTSAIIDALFICVSALVLLRLVLLAKNWRNVTFIPLLLLLAFLRILFDFSSGFSTAQWTSVIWIIIQFVMIVAGRVIPFFTARGLNIEKPQPISWLEQSVLIANIAFASVWWIDSSRTTPMLIGLLEATALNVAILHFIRWLLWKPYLTLKVPLLWSLHFSYLLIILGFAVIAMDTSNSAAIHLITIGGIGSLTLSMMVRVSLGHTGRELKINRSISWAFIALFLCAFVRASVLYFLQAYMIILWISLILWCMAFGIFLGQYYSILIEARIDGKPG